MPVRSSVRRRAVSLAVVAMIALGLLLAPPASAGQGYRSTMLHLVNDARARHDLRAVKLRVSLSRRASRHTRLMIRRDRVFDPPNLQQILAPYEWTHVGAAVVGCRGTLRGLHRALMNSTVHRGILLNPDVRRIGIGVVRSRERTVCGRNAFWATEILYG